MAIDPSSTPTRGPAPRGDETAPRRDGPSVWGEDGFTFGDVLDMVNPLQHLPVISMIYRGVTGDEIAQGPRIIGGMLFGGPTGAVFAAIDSSIEAETGRSFGGHIANAVTGGRLETPPTRRIVNPDPNAPGAAAVNAAALSDAEFWAMRMAPSDPQHPEGMVVGPVLTPPPSVATDLDYAQISARTIVAPLDVAAADPSPDGFVTGGAANAGAPPPPPAPRLSAPSTPFADAGDADPETVFAEMMRGLDRYDALRARDATEEG